MLTLPSEWVPKADVKVDPRGCNTTQILPAEELGMTIGLTQSIRLCGPLLVATMHDNRRR
jgi:hypothetical protein